MAFGAYPHSSGQSLDEGQDIAIPAAAGPALRSNLKKLILGHDSSLLPQTALPSPKSPRRFSRVILCSGLVILSVLGFCIVHVFPDNRSQPTTFSWTPFQHNPDSPSEDLVPQSSLLSDIDTWQTNYSPSSLCTPSNQPRDPHLMSVHSNSYNAFTLHEDTSRKPFSLLPVTPIPVSCLEEYFRGKICPGTEAETTGNNTPTAALAPMDIVWSWVNGSDPLHVAALSEAEHALSYATSKPKLYR